METHDLTTEELLVLLRDQSLKPQSIAEEMECAGARPPKAAEIAAARALVAELVAPSGDVADLAGRVQRLPPPLALPALRAAGEAGRQEVLRAVAVSAEKAVAKEAKRELQRLKQRGVKVMEVGPVGAPVLRPLPEAEAPSCFASSIDAYGERAVWYARLSRVGVEVVQTVISDVKGILAVDALGLSRRGFREFVKRLPREKSVFTVEIPRDEARALIASAVEEGARNGFSPPRGYAEALSILGPAPEERPPPPAIDLEAAEAAPLAQEGAVLFDDPLFGTWIPEEDALRSFGLRVDEIATSRLYLDEKQRAQALERAADDAAVAYFDAARRTLYARRLAEMARVLSGAGRARAAKTAMAVSLQIGAGSAGPFGRALFARALGPPAAAPSTPPSAASPIITPG